MLSPEVSLFKRKLEEASSLDALSAPPKETPPVKSLEPSVGEKRTPPLITATPAARRPFKPPKQTGM